MPIPRHAGQFALNLPENAVRLRRETGSSLWFSPGQLFTFVEDEHHPGDFKVKTLGYAYMVTDEEDLSRELVAWHWHPSSRPDTHLHVGKGHPDLSGLTHRVHLPTGRVSLEEVVFCLIREMNVRPARDDWEAVLADTLSRFKRYRRWA